MKKIIALLICLLLIALPIVGLASGDEQKRPRLIIESGTVAPEAASGGEDIELTVVIKNIGKADARYLSVNAYSESEFFTLASDLNGEFMQRLSSGKTREFTFSFRVSPRAVSGEYILHVDAAYEDESGMEHSCDAVFRAAIVQPVEISMDPVELPTFVQSGSSFIQLISVYNPSCAAAYNVHAALNVDGLVCASVFFPELAPGAQEVKELNVFVITLSGGYGPTGGELVLTYEDESGEIKTVTTPVSCTITEPEKTTDEDGERIAQEQKKQQTLSKWWISVLAAVAVIAILCSVIIAGKLARMAKIK